MSKVEVEVGAVGAKPSFDSQRAHLDKYVPAALDRAALVEPRLSESRVEYRKAPTKEAREAVVAFARRLVGAYRLQTDLAAVKVKVKAGEDPSLARIRAWDKLHDNGPETPLNVLYGEALSDTQRLEAWLAS